MVAAPWTPTWPCYFRPCARPAAHTHTFSLTRGHLHLCTPHALQVLHTSRWVTGLANMPCEHAIKYAQPFLNPKGGA